MAVAHDGEANLSGHSAAATTHALGNKTTAGSDRLAIVDVRFADAAFATEPASVTYGGAGMTQIGTGQAGGSNSGGVRSYYIVNPATGSTAVVVNTNSSTTVGYCVRSFNGVDQATPIDTAGVQVATGASTTPSVTVASAVGNMVLNNTTAANVFSANGAGQTQDAEFTDGGAYVARTSHEAGAASVVMDHTIGSATWATHGWEVNAVAAAAGGSFVPAISQNYRNMRNRGLLS